eukprot:8443800-Pyramimonas_sp.AAC.1
MAPKMVPRILPGLPRGVQEGPKNSQRAPAAAAAARIPPALLATGGLMRVSFHFHNPSSLRGGEPSPSPPKGFREGSRGVGGCLFRLLGRP